MIINGPDLYDLQPIDDMCMSKHTHTICNKVVSYGLTECGYDIRLKKGIWMYLGRRFVLGSSVEHFNMPRTLMGRVMNKSSWAREGIDVSRSTNIEPGWSGYLTLEITYSKVKPIYLPPGIGIAQVIFEEVKNPAQYKGKYQNQADEPVKAIFK